MLCFLPTVPEDVKQRFLSNWFWRRHSTFPFSCSWRRRHAMCPSNCSWGCQAMFPSQLVLKTSWNVSFQPFLRMSSNVSFQLFLKLSCNVSFQLFLKTSRNVSYPTGSEYVMQCFLTAVRDVMQCFLPTGLKEVMQCFLPNIPEISWNISFQLVLKMSCNLFFLSWCYAVSFPYCADSSECLFSFWYWFHANYIICLISDHSDVISQTYLNLFPCHSLAKVYVNHIRMHIV